MHCNPAAGKKCGETAPDNAPYCSIVKVLLAKSRVQSFAMTFIYERKGESLSGVMGKVSEQKQQEHCDGWCPRSAKVSARSVY